MSGRHLTPAGSKGEAEETKASSPQKWFYGAQWKNLILIVGLR